MQFSLIKRLWNFICFICKHPIEERCQHKWIREKGAVVFMKCEKCGERKVGF